MVMSVGSGLHGTCAPALSGIKQTARTVRNVRDMIFSPLHLFRGGSTVFGKTASFLSLRNPSDGDSKAAALELEICLCLKILWAPEYSVKEKRWALLIALDFGLFSFLVTP
jgi:hypothetical protein